MNPNPTPTPYRDIAELLGAAPTPWATLARLFRVTTVRIADDIGLEPSHLSRVWRGHVMPSANTARKILTASLPVRATWVAGWVGDIRELNAGPPTPAGEVNEPEGLEESYVPSDRADIWESLEIALRTVHALADPSTPPGTFATWRESTVSVITQSPSSAIRWKPTDSVWIAWLALRAVEMIVDHAIDWAAEVPPAIVEARRNVLGRSWDVAEDWDPSDALAAWPELMRWVTQWAGADSAPATPPTATATDPAWGALAAAWPSLDLADRARIADLAQRLARK